MHIFDMYKIGNDTDVSIKLFGEFSLNLSVPIPEMWQRRENMEGYHLRYNHYSKYSSFGGTEI